MMSALTRLLATWGASRSDIARALDIPEADIRRAGVNVLDGAGKLERFLVELSRAGQRDPATFMTINLVEGYTATGWRLYAEGAAELLLEHAAGALTAEEMLARHDPHWHTHYWTDFEVFLAGDGQHCIRRKSRS